MLFDSLMLRSVVNQVQSTASGSRVMRVFQTSRVELVLELSLPAPPSQLVLSCCPEFGRIHLDEGLEPDPTVSYPTGAVARRWLRSAVLVGVSQRQFDRAVRLEFANARALGPQSRCFVVLEVMGRYANLIILDEDGVILEAVKHVGADVNRYRQIEPGLEYVAPPGFDKLHPGDVTPEVLAGTVADAETVAGEWFRSALQGASGLFRDEALARAGIAPAQPSGELDAAGFSRLSSALAEMLREADSAAAYSYACPDGDFAYPLKLQSRPECRGERAESISAVVAAIASGAMTDTQLGEMRRRLMAAAERALRIVEKRIAERRDKKRRSENADDVRKMGEAILVSLREIPRGAKEVTLPDPYAPGTALSISLDPVLSPQANAQKYFARYKKLASLQERMPKLLRAAQRERYYVEGLLDQIEQASSRVELQALEEEMTRQGYVKEKRRRPPVAATKLELKWASAGGYRIMWGKSGMQNDELLRAARPDDIWLHTRKTPGGHVIIRTDGRAADVPEEVLLRAAQQAAWLSKRRNDSSVAIDYTLARYVRRLKGTPPGYVHYTKQKTVFVEPAELAPQPGS